MGFSDAFFGVGRLFPRVSRAAGETPSLREGELAANAADGVMYVGKVDGTAGTIPGAVGFNQIVSLTQAEYDAITPDSDTLYIIT